MSYPGAILEQFLKDEGMSQKELSQRIGVSEKHISVVINGSKGISSGFARKLGYVFKDTAFWLELQAKYDEEQLRIKEENSISSDEIAIMSSMNEISTYFIEKGYIHNDCGEASKVIQLREFLNVSDLQQIPKVTYNAAYRAQLSTNIKIDPYVLFAWQRLCEKETEHIKTGQLNTELLRNRLPEIKDLMFGNINKGIGNLQKLFAECGIAFNVVKNFRGAPVQGFIKEMANHKLIMCLTIRGQRADRFWFTLFHEIAHVLNNDYSTRFVDFDSSNSEAESKADKFAADSLISPDLYRDFIHSRDCTSWKSISRFAESTGVLPFIVLGRLQKDGILDWSDYSSKVLKYRWA